ncbi:type IX secretion system membrane protein PorP/SprF [Ancylomarina sp.]|uniref:PorP/SprF family type IX secretion system membrane protein n=1 Tax=Ancylomarina sp. TaxID=1970196 RepID=UPI0035682B2E
MKKRLFILLFLIGLVISSFGQQDKMFTQYQNYPSSINPAYAGSRGSTQILGIARKQWVGLDGAPKSAVLSINSPISFFNMGVGLTLETDVIGPEKSTDVGVDLSYKIKLAKTVFMNFGLKAGLTHQKVDLTNSRVVDQYDPLIQELNNDVLPNFGVGNYVYGEDFFVGFSIPRLLQTEIKSGGISSAKLDKSKLHYFLMAGYLIKVNPFIKLKPTMLLKATQGSRLSWDLSATAIFLDRFWLGTSFRNEDSVAAIFQVNINNQLRLGYSYDIAVSKLSSRTHGSHEISMSYDIVFKSKKLRSPRYF